jgi:hypothetical protein
MKKPLTAEEKAKDAEKRSLESQTVKPRKNHPWRRRKIVYFYAMEKVQEQ